MRKVLHALVRFALPYVVVALIPLIAVFYLRDAIAEQYEAHHVAYRQTSIESAFSRFQTRVEDIQSMGYHIARNSVTASYAYSSMRGFPHDPLDNIKLQKYLNEYWANSDIVTLFVYDSTNNSIATPLSVLANAEDYFRFSYCFAGVDPQDSVELITERISEFGFSPAQEITIHNATQKIVEYRLPLPLGLSQGQTCQLILAVQAEKVFSDVLDVLKPNEECYFFDKTGKIIYSSGNKFESLIMEEGEPEALGFGDGSFDILTLKTDDSSWILKICLSEASEESLNQVPGHVTVWVILSVLTSTVLSVGFTIHNYRQIRELLQMMRGEKTIQENVNIGFRDVKAEASRILNENDHFRTESVRSAFSRKYHLMDMLLRGTYENEDALLSNMEREQIRIPEGSKTVICVQCGDLNRVKKLLEQFHGEQTAVFRTSPEECVSIMSTKKLDLLSLLHRLEEESITASAGDPVRDLRQLCVAYSQSKTVLRYREVSGCRVYRYEEVSNLENSFLWPKTYDDKLHNLIVSLNCEEATKLVDEVYRSNFGPRAPMLSFRAIEALKGKLKNLLFSMADQYDIPVEDLLIQGDAAVNIGEFFRIVHEVIVQMIEQLGTKNRCPSVSLAEQMRSYIDVHYSEPTLSVKQLASQMGFHENYISAQFKNEFGEILSGYIERKRIEKASALLRSTNMRISEISVAVGYSTDISFRRAFKKLTGVSPVTFREDVT